MAFFIFDLRSFLLAVAVSALVQAAPWPVHVKHTTHNTRFYARGLALETYHPKSTFKTYRPDTKASSGASSFASGETIDSNWRLNDSAMSFVSSELGINSSNIGYRKGWSGANGKFAYMGQYIDGIPVANAAANVVYSNTSQVVSFGSSFVDTKGATVAPSTPTVKWQDVLPAIEDLLNGTHNGIPPSVEYLAKEDGSLALTYVMQIQNPDADLWVEAFVCAHSGDLLSVTDFTAHATYNVVPFNKQNFLDGREAVVDPEDSEASPIGWFTESGIGIIRYLLRLSGNNVVVFANGSSFVNSRRFEIQPDANGAFDNPYDIASPLDARNLGATATNTFYVMNTMHDLAYRYGFQEEQGNFQVDYFGKSRARDNPVTVSIRDFTGINNANFATPPIGQTPIARFFFFQSNEDTRDSAMANDILIHEYTHGITNRMIGGGTSRCMQTRESGGMGEGYSDMMAAWVAQTSAEVPEFRVGNYVSSNGIRSRPYSTDENVNPLKYSDVARRGEPHAIGEVWANTLYNVYAELVKERGFAPNALIEPDGLEGNAVFMRIMMDSLLLQPCNPSMIQARDAMLLADSMRYNGANECTLWRAFAGKGMGVDAGPLFTNGFSVPPECQV